jgi:hypothetical protein
MAAFIFLHHGDGRNDVEAQWDSYLNRLQALGRFEGGSGIGEGGCFRKVGEPAAFSGHITGYIRVTAQDLSDAATLLAGNPVYESGGTVEIRELPQD